MKLSPETGLPELPEKIFWRVTYSRSMKWYELQLRKKLPIGSKKLGWWAMRPHEFNQDEILDWAQHAMRRTEVQDKILRASGATVIYEIDRQLLGDYPPKKLGG